MNGRDLGLLAGLMAAAPLSWITPEWSWRMFSFLVASLDVCLNIKRTRRRTRMIKQVCEAGLEIPAPVLIEIHVLAGFYEQYLQYLREYRPGGWRPSIRLRARKNIEQALAGGQGGILWVGPFLYSNLVVKKGLQQDGFTISHLSVYDHGPSSTRFGLRFINPIKIKAENRYLEERITIPLGGKLGYIRRIKRRLRENGLISIPCRAFGEKIAEQPILGGRIQLATGAPSFALATRAALLPVFTIRNAPGDFEITIEPPLELPEAKSRHEAVEILLFRYVKLMESYVARYPTSFMRWSRLRAD